MKQFKDYLEARRHITLREKELGKDYYCTPEYKELWPIVNYLWEKEYGSAYRAKKLLTKQIRQDSIKYGFPVALFM